MNEELMAEGKLWKGTKNHANIRISLYGRQNCIQIGKDVLRVLGAPPFIGFRINKEMDSIVIEPAQEKAPLSFPVPEGIMFDKNKQMTVTSASFVIGIMSLNGLDLAETYQIEGVYSEKNNAAIFNINESKLYVHKDRKTKK
jgi:hypothetical protein